MFISNSNYFSTMDSVIIPRNAIPPRLHCDQLLRQGHGGHVSWLGSLSLAGGKSDSVGLVCALILNTNV